ncbi:hypothetical protein [Nitriliruptor alkaliphilus]|uniref:hypothetical protein n=1 Tax=Nitriliruptor alkaliphilus TaxID=427918 RepID=UPI0012EEDACA|nr:hypothetical protein [Nitriliruptor alkaliphilus]
MAPDFRRGRPRVGAAVAVALALLTITHPASAHDGPALNYRWVDGSGAGVAAGRAADLPADRPTELWTPDMQALLVLPAEALPGPPGATVPAELRPVDAATLAPLPEGLAPASNAYLVDLDLAASGWIVLAAAHPAVALLRSSDGSTWEVVPHDRLYGSMVGGPLEEPGLFLVASEARGGVPAWVLSGGALAVGLALLFVERRRRRQPVG